MIKEMTEYYDKTSNEDYYKTTNEDYHYDKTRNK